MNYLEIMSLITVHWLADFVLQTHWQATNKSKNNLALASHVSIYCCVLTIFSFIIFNFPNNIIWVGTNTILHFITDYITSRITSKLYAKKDYHNFFVVIGLDQMIHYACLFGLYFYFK